jgi:hypothetical protein
MAGIMWLATARDNLLISCQSMSKHHIFHELFLNFNFLIWFSIFFVNFNDVLLDLQLNKQKVGLLFYGV